HRRAGSCGRGLRRQPRRRVSPRRAPRGTRARAPSTRCGSTPSPRLPGAACVRPFRCPAIQFREIRQSPSKRLRVESTTVSGRGVVAYEGTKTRRFKKNAVPRVATCLLLAAVSAASRAAEPRVLRWAGDPEGGAPFVEADPSHPDQLVGFDVEIAELFARPVGRSPEFGNIRFAALAQTIGR